MKIIKIPTHHSENDIEVLSKIFRQETPEERIIFIRSDIDIIELSLQDLYKIRGIINKEISDRELIIPDERNKS